MPTSFLPLSYTYMNAFVLAFGVWGIVNQESTDAISMVSLKVDSNFYAFILSIVFDSWVFCYLAEAEFKPTFGHCLKTNNLH